MDVEVVENQAKNRQICEALEPELPRERNATSIWNLYATDIVGCPQPGDLHSDPAAMVALKEACWKVKGWSVDTYRDRNGEMHCSVQNEDMSLIVEINRETEMLAVRDAVYGAIQKEQHHGKQGDRTGARDGSSGERA